MFGLISLLWPCKFPFNVNAMFPKKVFLPSEHVLNVGVYSYYHNSIVFCTVGPLVTSYSHFLTTKRMVWIKDIWHQKHFERDWYYSYGNLFSSQVVQYSFKRNGLTLIVVYSLLVLVQCPVLLVIGYWLCYDAKANKVFFMTKFIFTLRSFGCINASKFNFNLNSITSYFMAIQFWSTILGFHWLEPRSPL